jgi:superfamily II DNA helicase RecQ
MSGKKQRVYYHLNSGDLTGLSTVEISAILRAADEIIAQGGRSMLAKILKGSKDKRILEYGLDKSPVYEYYKHLTLPEIARRIDWMIENDYFRIIYNDRLPLIVYSETGWEIERKNYAEELLQKLSSLLDKKDYSFVNELKDRNKGMILLLLDKIKNTNNRGFIPILEAWQEIDYKKVRAAIEEVVGYLKRVR